MIDGEYQQKLNARFNPPGSKLRELQLQMLDILVEFDRICRENDIVYWLSSGTLLGAVRHGGFIPWDDDIDVDMYEDDFRRFSDVIKRKGFSNPSFVLQSEKSEAYYFLNHAKIRDEKTLIIDTYHMDRWFRYSGIFIDIFRMKRCSGFVYSLFRPVGRLLFKLYYLKPNFASKILLKIYDVLIINCCCRMIGAVSGLFSSDYYNPVGSAFLATSRRKDRILPVKEIVFEGHRFFAPADSDRYLKSMFGDYMKLPNLDEIKTHSIL